MLKFKNLKEMLEDCQVTAEECVVVPREDMLEILGELVRMRRKTIAQARKNTSVPKKV
ncbi:MAG: hypothetical protein SO119_04300 [Phascolarctobacterium sp.]|nr:hypothetical protein [Phascolarctobacterium sp.]